MNTQPARLPSSSDDDWVWQQFEHNFARHLIGLSRHWQATTLLELTQGGAHQGLRLSFEPYISMPGRKGCRLTDMALWLGVSKQACNQLANQIEALGYIERRSDSSDARAKLIVLTNKGKQLIHDGEKVVVLLLERYTRLAGEKDLNAFADALETIATELRVPMLPSSDLPAASRLGLLLPKLSVYIQRRLMQLTASKGHTDLTMAFGQVLPYIGRHGSNVSEIARLQDVSKQAISQTANRLQALGYIEKTPDPNDGRSTRLRFSPRGKQLIANSVASIQEIEMEFTTFIGRENLETCKVVASMLFSGFNIESGRSSVAGKVVDSSGPASEPVTSEEDLLQIARNLRYQLGSAGARSLAELLSSINADSGNPHTAQR